MTHSSRRDEPSGARSSQAVRDRGRPALGVGVATLGVVLSLWATLCLCTAARAEEAAVAPAGPAELEEVVVTAQKRTETLLNVPLSITVINSATIERADITNFMDYALKAPSLTFSYSAGQGSLESRSIAIRGIQGGDTTGVYLDDLPLPAGVDPHALDLARIEVLRGPQGTLYGARSMGGTVRLITQAPNPGAFDAEAYSKLAATDAGGPSYEVDAGVNLPLGERAAVRLNAFSLTVGGWENRQFPAADGSVETAHHVARQDEVGGSIAILLKATDDLTIKPMVMYQRSKWNGLPLSDYAAKNSYNVRLFNVPEALNDEWTMTGLTVNYHLAVGDITSATSYFTRHVFENEDSTDFTAYALGYSPPLPGTLPTWEPQHEFVQELRYASTLSGPAQVVGGVYYARRYTGFVQNGVLPGLAQVNGGVFGTDLAFYANLPRMVYDRAVFGEVSYDIAPKWTATAGLRYSTTASDFKLSEDGIFTGGPVHDRGYSREVSTTPKVALKFRPTEDQSYYVLASKGFRPGGPNYTVADFCAGDLAALGQTVGSIKSYHADTVWNYEAGAKLRFPEQRLSINSSVYYIDWKNIQQIVRLPSCGYQYTGNAGAARSRGVEFEIAMNPLQGLSLSFGAGYDDAKITATSPNIPVYVGEPVQQVAPWTVTGSADYERPLTDSIKGIARIDGSFVDHSYSAANDQMHPRLRPSYEIINVRTGIAVGHVETFLFVENATNARPNLSDNQSQAAELPGRPRILTSPPRTFGIDVRVKFQ